MDIFVVGSAWRLPSGRIARVIGHAWKELHLVLRYEDDGDQVTLKRQFLVAHGVAI
jgi:hypothetical protein